MSLASSGDGYADLLNATERCLAPPPPAWLQAHAKAEETLRLTSPRGKKPTVAAAGAELSTKRHVGAFLVAGADEFSDSEEGSEEDPDQAALLAAEAAVEQALARAHLQQQRLRRQHVQEQRLLLRLRRRHPFLQGTRRSTGCVDSRGRPNTIAAACSPTGQAARCDTPESSRGAGRPPSIQWRRAPLPPRRAAAWGVGVAFAVRTCAFARALERAHGDAANELYLSLFDSGDVTIPDSAGVDTSGHLPTMATEYFGVMASMATTPSADVSPAGASAAAGAPPPHASSQLVPSSALQPPGEMEALRCGIVLAAAARGVSQDALLSFASQLAAAAKLVWLNCGQELWQHGSPSDALYYVAGGQLKVVTTAPPPCFPMPGATPDAFGAPARGPAPWFATPGSPPRGTSPTQGGSATTPRLRTPTASQESPGPAAARTLRFLGSFRDSSPAPSGPSSAIKKFRAKALALASIKGLAGDRLMKTLGSVRNPMGFTAGQSSHNMTLKTQATFRSGRPPTVRAPRAPGRVSTRLLGAEGGIVSPSGQRMRSSGTLGSAGTIPGGELHVPPVPPPEIYRDGDWVGVDGVVSGAPRASTCTAQGPTQLWRVDRADLLRMHHSDPDAAAVLSVVAGFEKSAAFSASCELHNNSMQSIPSALMASGPLVSPPAGKVIYNAPTPPTLAQHRQLLQHRTEGLEVPDEDFEVAADWVQAARAELLASQGLVDCPPDEDGGAQPQPPKRPRRECYRPHASRKGDVAEQRDQEREQRKVEKARRRELVFFKGRSVSPRRRSPSPRAAAALSKLPHRPARQRDCSGLTPRPTPPDSARSTCPPPSPSPAPSIVPCPPPMERPRSAGLRRPSQRSPTKVLLLRRLGGRRCCSVPLTWRHPSGAVTAR
eukprot:TRINITY_DN4101_c0_g1_i1.p1 TRINITY_DN4101_c0_g1~~TRINITY_DN4101_c0_g1_i1.p1  ORF type:complete len:890 (+),score=159.93 TRINITY_DN4101_c0_g1_i1:72-2741(+)